MSNTIAVKSKDFSIQNIIFDAAAITLVYFIPAISHMLSVPLYLADPMRILILLALIHTTGRNTYLIAVTLPLFSYLISSHPVALKAVLISAELLVNIFLFYKLSEFVKNSFLVMFTSILLSKLFYYTAKAILLSTSLLKGELVSTPMEIQLLVMIVISGYFFFINKYKGTN